MKICLLTIFTFIGCAFCVTNTDLGDGIVYTLSVTQDVALETNAQHHTLEYLMVGKHPQYPNKRSLLEFEDLPTACSACNIKWAKMYVYYRYAHKPSWHSVQETPFISRPIQVYQVKKSWNEAQGTSTKRYNSAYWSQEYLEITQGQDAGPDIIGTTTISTSRPKGFVEFDVTTAMRNWRNGQNNYGLLLRAANEYTEGRDIRFYSNANSDNTTHAYINVLCDY